MGKFGKPPSKQGVTHKHKTKQNQGNTPRTPSHSGMREKRPDGGVNLPASLTKPEGLWLYGKHPVMAALVNTQRKKKRLLLTPQAQKQWQGNVPDTLAVMEVEPSVLEAILPQGAVHQGIALEVMPLDTPSLEAIAQTGRPILLLDQVTDPHNIGAILRSAAAFEAACVIVTDYHAPEETGVLAKSASGALEVMPLLRVTNLAHTMKQLKGLGYWIAGMDGKAEQTLKQANLSGKTALVMGAEGAGLRRLTQENCDYLVKLPISLQMESLNVSNAAAIALYELYSHHKGL